MVAAAFLLLSACASGPEASPVTVDSVGSTRSENVIAVAARVRVEAGKTFGPISLRVRFRDADGDEVASTKDGLPYCPPRTDCWWAATFPVDQFERPKEIRTAGVESVGKSTPYGDDGDVVPFEVSKQEDGRVHGVAPGDEGFVYVVGSVGGDVRGGIFVSVTPELGRDVNLTQSDAEVLGPDAALRAYFYATRVARGR